MGLFRERGLLKELEVEGLLAVVVLLVVLVVLATVWLMLVCIFLD
jgi:hypothetical protein